MTYQLRKDEPELPVAQIKQELRKAIDLINAQRLSEARAVFNRLNEIETDDIEIIRNLGSVAFALKEHVDAIYYYSKACDLYPRNTDYMFSLAKALYYAGESGEASTILLEVIDINPKMAAAYAMLGLMLNYAGEHEQAVERLEKAIELKPSEPEPYFGLIVALKNTDRYEESYAYAKKLIRLKKSAGNYNSLSNVQKELGDIDEAVRSAQKAIELDDTYGYAYINLSQLKKFTDDDLPFIQRTEKVLNKSMPAEFRATIEFSLGKMYNDTKQWDSAFEHYRQGNALAREAIDPTTDYDKSLKTARKQFPRGLLQQQDLVGSDSDVPVFVIGMPRSGTTLIDQIISAHPGGGTVGESAEIGFIHASMFSKHGDDADTQERGLTKPVLEKYAQKYLDFAQGRNEGASRIVDKMPENYQSAGLIHQLFPNARIIHSVRNPLDTCLSCYFQYFQTIPWAFDLEWIARRYRYYRRMMGYWKSVLPAGTIYDFSYDEVVANPESQIPALVDHVGLEWDDACMAFHQSQRTIRTASLWQARQPLYKSSSRRWVNYAPHIEALAKGLADYLDDGDRDELARHGIKIRKKWKLF